MSSEKPPVVVEYSINWSGQGASMTDTFEVDRDEWNALTPAERTKLVDAVAEAAVGNEVQWGWHIPDPDDMAATA